MKCSQAIQIHRYHDGELSAAARRGVEEHLLTCVECGDLLADLRRLSALIESAAPAEAPAAVLRRLHDMPRTVREQGVLRVAGWLTAAAAAVLIAALVKQPPASTDMATAAAGPELWETLAVTPTAQLDEEGDAELAIVAQWMADELSSGETW